MARPGANGAKLIADSIRKVTLMKKRFLLLAAIGGLVFATGMTPADAAPRRAADGTEAAASSMQRSQATRDRSASQGQKANRQNRSSGNKANRTRVRRGGTSAG